MKQVTRDIDPHLAQDLLERVPRACLSFASEHGPQVQPVAVHWQDGRCLVGIPAGVSDRPEPGQEAVLLIDEGIYYFDLRAIYIRGQTQPAEVPRGGQAKNLWLELIPTKTVAWDYGSMREVELDDEG
jgi:hypothetical protein